MAAYGLWGFLPLYFQFLGAMPPLTVVHPGPSDHLVSADRAHSSWLPPLASWASSPASTRQPRLLFTLLGSSLAIGDQLDDLYLGRHQPPRARRQPRAISSNPIVVFLFAAIFFGERFRPLQLVALVIAALGVLNQTLVVGQFPWVSLSLAFSFAIYGADTQDNRRRQPHRLWHGGALARACRPALLPLLPAGGDRRLRVRRARGLSRFSCLAGPLTATPLILFADGGTPPAPVDRRHPAVHRAQHSVSDRPRDQGEHFTMAHAVTLGLIWLGVIMFTLAGRQSRPCCA